MNVRSIFQLARSRQDWLSSQPPPAPGRTNQPWPPAFRRGFPESKPFHSDRIAAHFHASLRRSTSAGPVERIVVVPTVTHRHFNRNLRDNLGSLLGLQPADLT